VSTFDPDALEADLGRLDEQMGSPGFWDDARRAGKLAAERAQKGRRLELFRALTAELDDLPGMVALAREDGDFVDEVAEAVERIRGEIDGLEEAAFFTGEYDAGPAVVTLNAGAGGTDAQDWAEMLLRMYLRWSERRRFKADLIEATPGEEAGLKSATFALNGENAYGIMQAERGVHRLVRQSPFDNAHRRHTAFAGVEVAPYIDDDVSIEIDEKDLRIDTYRASGAGGQHVNKTDSAVRITHLPTGVVVQCQNERSQTQNKETALRVLKSRLLERELKAREAEVARERGDAQDISFGSQIRSYVLHPYTVVNDHRTDVKEGNAQAVLDGDLDPLIHAYLLARAAQGGGRGQGD
jgi:peptide chain release factor 2